MPLEERTMQRSVHIRECSPCPKQKRQGYCFLYSSKLYQLLNLQIDAKFFPISMWRHSFSSTLYYLEALCQSRVCMLGFVFLLKREALINLGTRVKKSKIITTSNNCIAICSLPPLQSAILFNPQDNLVKLVPLPPLCRGGNSG